MSTATLDWDDNNNTLSVTFTGNWLLDQDLPAADELLQRLSGSPKISGVAFDTNHLGEWDTGLVKTLIAVHQVSDANSISVDDSGLPDGARQLIALAFAVKEREGARRTVVHKGIRESVGETVYEVLDDSKELLTFVGELFLSAGRFLTGKATYRKSDLWHYVQQAGAEAFPIVSLISFLIGMIFAFVGVKQLSLFGAGIFTADLVAIAMVREMSAIMTAIIMAGRTGAAYAAQIGTMKVNEEIDALTTLGLEPSDYLVTPRIIALILMMPLLTMYASLMGILGGTFVGLFMLDVSLSQYVQQTIAAVDLDSLFGGLFKSIVYGTLVAIAGCSQGVACGNSAMAVGEATTKAVVMGIVLIVVSASVLTVIYINLGI